MAGSELNVSGTLLVGAYIRAGSVAAAVFSGGACIELPLCTGSFWLRIREMPSKSKVVLLETHH